MNILETKKKSPKKAMWKVKNNYMRDIPEEVRAQI